MFPMRFERPLVLGTLLVVAAGCGGGALKLHFKVNRDIDPQTISSSLTPCALTSNLPVGVLGNPFTMTITQQQDFPQQNTDVQHITSAKLDQLSFTLTSTSPQQNWDFLKDITISAEATGQTKAAVASIGADTVSGIAIVAGSTTLTLKPTGLNLAPYIKANGGFSLSSEAIGCPPPQDADFSGHVRISITADPLN